MPPRHRQIVEFIQGYRGQNGYPPTVDEIGQAIGLRSKSTVHGYLDRMRKQRLVDWEDGKPRTLRVVE